MFDLLHIIPNKTLNKKEINLPNYGFFREFGMDTNNICKICVVLNLQELTATCDIVLSRYSPREAEARIKPTCTQITGTIRLSQKLGVKFASCFPSIRVPFPWPILCI